MSIAAEIVRSAGAAPAGRWPRPTGPIHTGTGHEDAVVADPVIA